MRRPDRLPRRLRDILPAAPSVHRAELGDLSGALGAVVAALHAAYGRLGLADLDLARVPHREALAGFAVRQLSLSDGVTAQLTAAAPA
ncbi:hypothetical protein [Micromonospora sp. NPDC049679]|uniref:hypothetical protein n=1 Tax=Micromonospora sp. NPDC049679 TaxID=3155920 RepID=UPI0034016783